MILETDGSVIAGKVASHNMDDGSPISEQVNSTSLIFSESYFRQYSTFRKDEGFLLVGQCFKISDSLCLARTSWGPTFSKVLF